MATPEPIEAIPVSRLFLSLLNPRHEPLASEGAAIEYLCEHEYVYELARDISRHGLNPLERFALVKTGKGASAKGSAPTYFVAEGNRRICAIKLLNDPDLAPAHLRKGFERLSKEWPVIRTVAGVVFASLTDVDLWLDRIHKGLQGGAGRKEWNADQKTRHAGQGGGKNRFALTVLDYAESKGLISAEERKGRLTTVQRFVVNDAFREAMGLDNSDPDALQRTRPESELDALLKRFIKDLLGGQDVNSRMNRKDIIDYARKLHATPGVSAARVEPEPVSSDPLPAHKKTKPPRPLPPERLRHVSYDERIDVALRGLGNDKLKSLYNSICNIDIEPHTPILSVGVWSFFETLTICAGRNEQNSLDSYLSKGKLKSYGIAGDTVTLQSATKRIREYGNTTKHHPTGAMFNAGQLNNDVVTLAPVILKIIEEAGTKP